MRSIVSPYEIIICNLTTYFTVCFNTALTLKCLFICYRRASRPTAIFYLFHYPTNLIDLQYHATPNTLDISASI